MKGYAIKKVMIVLLAMGMFQVMLTGQEKSGRTRVFKRYNCQLTLPEGYVWNDEVKDDAMLALMQKDSTLMMLMVTPVEYWAKGNDDAFIKAFERGCYSGGIYKKISGKKRTFLGFPAYNLLSSFTKQPLVSDSLIFPIRGDLYVLQIIRKPSAKVDAEKLFSAFKFIKKPKPISVSR